MGTTEAKTEGIPGLLRTVAFSRGVSRSVLTAVGWGYTMRFMTARRSLFLALALLLASFLAFAAPANAAENPDYTADPPTERVDPVVSPNSVRRAPAAPAVLNSRQTLAITGSDVAGIAVIGTVLLGTGAALLVVRRRVIA